MALIEPHFDADYYIHAYPDVKAAGMDPLRHYFLHGWLEDRDPTPEFSTREYLHSNPDVASAGVNPFWHYIAVGRAEGRSWKTSLKTYPQMGKNSAAAGDASEDDPITETMSAIRDAFDHGFYLRKNPDVAAAGIDPLRHFVTAGWREGRDPNSRFSTRYYLAAHPDVATSGVNPFWHYVVAGNAEGRLPSHPGGYRTKILEHNGTIEEMVAAWRTSKEPGVLLDVDALCRCLRDAGAGKSRSLMISISHDNYRENPGGVQFCIQHEEKAATRRGMIYLNLHPYQPLPRLAHASEDPDIAVCVLLGGASLGVARMSVVVEAMKVMASEWAGVEIVVHHLLGHHPEQVALLANAVGRDRCWLWLHDFFSLCPSFALQRNNVSFCGAPGVASNSCVLCLYGDERRTHLMRFEALFDVLDVHVIAPSTFVAEYWSARSSLRPASLRVCEHMTIDWVAYKKRTKRKRKAGRGAQCEKDSPIVIAFVGHPAAHKGWHVFEDVVLSSRGQASRYRFLHFGIRTIPMEGIEQIPVVVTSEQPDAMIRALAEHKVDFVLHWANWGETFSFSTFEALAAGAFVLTNAISGNVAATVLRTGRGAVFENAAELVALLSGDRVAELAGEVRALRRNRTAVMTRSDMTLSVLDRKARV